MRCPTFAELPSPPEGKTGWPRTIERPHLLLVTQISPNLGTGSGIVLLRHLTRLHKTGWDLTVAMPTNEGLEFNSSGDRPWTSIFIPRRKKFWPPVRPRHQWSIQIRARLQARYLDKVLLHTKPPTHVLALLWGDTPLAAAKFAKKRGLPLMTLVHDREEEWAKSTEELRNIGRRNQSIIDYSYSVLAVTKELLESYNVQRSKGNVLLPIPGDQTFFDIPSTTQMAPKVFFGGSLHSWQIENFEAISKSLAKHGGNLVLLTNDDNPVWLRLKMMFPNTERYPPPASNDAAVKLVAQYGTAFLVSYSMESSLQSWGRTSFPSKMLDFARAGKPIIVMAPEHTAIHAWCKYAKWETLISDLREVTLDEVVERIREPNYRQSAIEQIQRLASSDFSAAVIHAKLEACLCRARRLGARALDP